MKRTLLALAGITLAAALSACSLLSPHNDSPSAWASSVSAGDEDVTVIFATQGPSGTYKLTYFAQETGAYAVEKVDFNADSEPAHHVLVVPKGKTVEIDISVDKAEGKERYEQLTSCSIVDSGPATDDPNEAPPLVEAQQYGVGNFTCTWENE